MLGDIYGRLHNWIVYPVITGLLAAGGLFLFSKTIFPDKEKPLKIFVVGDFTDKHDAGNPKADAIRIVLSKYAGCRDPNNEIPKLNRWPVCVESRNDDGDLDEAKQIAQEISKDPSALMVIGHFGSTRTQAVLPSYLVNTSPPISIILASDSNPDLLRTFQPTENDPRLPVLRLSRPDNEEAMTAARFAATKACSFWIVEDGSNDKYTGYLARNFVNHLLKYKCHSSEASVSKSSMQLPNDGDTENCESQTQDDASDRPQIIAWSHGMNLPAAPELKDLCIDGVFFAGQSQNAVILIQQVNRAFRKGRAPKIFIGDMAANADLLHAGRSALLNTFATTRLPAKTFMADLIASDALASRKEPRDQSTWGYSDLALTTLKILKVVIQLSNENYTQGASAYSWTFNLRHAVGIDTPRDARAAVDYWVSRISNDKHDDSTISSFSDDDQNTVRSFIDSNCDGCGEFSEYYREANDARIYLWSVCASGDGIECSTENSKGPKAWKQRGGEPPSEPYIFHDIATPGSIGEDSEY